MKRIELPKVMAVRLYLNGAEPKSKAPVDSHTDAVAAIEKNAAEIITAAVLIEDRMVEATAKLLFGSQPLHKERTLFVNEIMSTSDMSYKAKRHAFTSVMEVMGTLGSEDLKALKRKLNNIMHWRNAFAHGNLMHEHNAGYVITYYSGGHKELVLDDELFEHIEQTIRDCLYACNGVIEGLRERT
ncbi:hypothetical protein [Rhodanobacter glycinis]|nr:hypothetical protein [Rhodanobacter glycinis]